MLRKNLKLPSLRKNSITAVKMQISCKCLNFIATSNSQAANSNVGIVGIVGASISNGPSTTDSHSTRNNADDDNSMPLAQQSIGNCNNAGNANINSNNLCTTLMHAFLQRYPRTFIFYSQCMEFFKQVRSFDIKLLHSVFIYIFKENCYLQVFFKVVLHICYNYYLNFVR